MLEPKNGKILGEQLFQKLVMSLSGVEVILSVHRSMFNDLSDRVKNWQFHTRLGEVFLHIVRFFIIFLYFFNIITIIIIIIIILIHH